MRLARVTGTAFTIIEMLIAAVMIAILSSLTAAAIARAKATALRAECASNLKQHGAAIQSFLADHSSFPLYMNPGWDFGIEPDHASTFYGALARHGLGSIGTNRVYRCPSAARQKHDPAKIPRELTMYGYNAHGMGRFREDEPIGLGGMRHFGQAIVTAVRESSVVAPSDMLLLGDGVRGWNKIYEDGVGVIARSSDATEFAGSIRRVPQRHHKRLQAVFVDGHVESLPLARLFESRADSDLRIWNRDNLPHRDRVE